MHMEKLNQVLADNFGLSINEVTQNLTMKDVSNWDSISHMNLIVNIEEIFKIELTGDDIADMTSFDQIRSVVERYVKL
jgi:acyl carrier protein